MNALFIVRSKLISFSRNNPKYQYVRGPPEHSSIVQVQVQVEFIVTHAGVKIISAVSYYTCT